MYEQVRGKFLSVGQRNCGVERQLSTQAERTSRQTIGHFRDAFASVSKRVFVLNHSSSFSHKRFCTKPRFETEAKGDSEMACWRFFHGFLSWPELTKIVFG